MAWQRPRTAAAAFRYPPRPHACGTRHRQASGLDRPRPIEAYYFFRRLFVEHIATSPPATHPKPTYGQEQHQTHSDRRAHSVTARVICQPRLSDRQWLRSGLSVRLGRDATALPFRPSSICFHRQLARTTETPLERTVSMGAVIRPTWEALANRRRPRPRPSRSTTRSFSTRKIRNIGGHGRGAVPTRNASHLANLSAYAIIFHWQRSPSRPSAVPFLLGTLREFPLCAVCRSAGRRRRRRQFVQPGPASGSAKSGSGSRETLSSHRYHHRLHLQSRPAIRGKFLGAFAGVWLTSDMTVGHLLLASSFTWPTADRVDEGGRASETARSAYIDYSAPGFDVGPPLADCDVHWHLASRFGHSIGRRPCSARYDEGGRGGHRSAQSRSDRLQDPTWQRSVRPRHRGCELSPNNAGLRQLTSPARCRLAAVLYEAARASYRGSKALGDCYKEFSQEGTAAKSGLDADPLGPAEQYR